MRGSIDDHIAWFDEQIERLDHAIEAAATACTLLTEPLGRLRAIPGVGRVVGLTLLTLGRGKSKKGALAAVARKLLIAINAMIRDQRPWQPAIVAEPSCC